MKRALAYPRIPRCQAVPRAGGIVSITIDPEIRHAGRSGAAPSTRSEVYIAGTEPVGVCPLHGGRGGITTVAGWDTAAPRRTPPPPAHCRSDGYGLAGRWPGPADPARAPRRAPGSQRSAPAPPTPPPHRERGTQEGQEKKGIFQRSLVCLNSSKGAIWLTDLGPS